jgi:hypothetical protein
LGRLVLLCVVALVAAAWVSQASAARSFDRGKFNYNTHTYITQTRGCITATSLFASILQETTDQIELAVAETRVRNICDSIRSRLLRINTDHFSDQATQAWYRVDRMKSGLKAFLNYLDTGAPSKVIEARDKLLEGRATVKAINARRRAYGQRG